jgi:anti-sigma B factor antagonist
MGMQEFHISPLRPADGVIVVQVSGEIDMTNSLAFRQRLFGELDERATQVVLDLHAAIRVDTTGLSVILDLAKRCAREDRKLAIVCPEGWVRRALANSSLDQMIVTHATLDEALGHGGAAV